MNIHISIFDFIAQVILPARNDEGHIIKEHLKPRKSGDSNSSEKHARTRSQSPPGIHNKKIKIQFTK